MPTLRKDAGSSLVVELMTMVIIATSAYLLTGDAESVKIAVCVVIGHTVARMTDPPQ